MIPHGNLASLFPKQTCCTDLNMQLNGQEQKEKGKKSTWRDSHVVKADISLWQLSTLLFPALETLDVILKRDTAKGEIQILTASGCS